MAHPLYLLLSVALLTLFPALPASSFSFSEYEDQEQGSEAVHALADLHCPKSLTASKVATMIGELHRGNRYIYRGYWGGSYLTEQSVYGRLIDKLNTGFERLGLATYSEREINEQVAREEQEAFLNNDLEAAMSAAERLKADYMLKGVISTHTQINNVVKVDEVFVTIDLTLYNDNGLQISTARAREATFSDADITATIQDIVSRQADRITYELFAEHCKGGE